MTSELTIGIATYNGERYVKEAVASALAANAAQVVVLDDCSTDATPAILEAFGSSIRFKRQEQNVGIAQQYQDLLEACETPLALLLNQDDLVLPRWFNTIRPKRNEVTVLNGWVIDGSGERQRLIYRRPPYHALVKGVYRGLRIQSFSRSPSQVIFPVEEARDAGGFEIPGDLGQGAEDWLCLLRLAAAGVKFRLKFRPAMAYREHSGNFSHHSDSHLASKKAVIENFPSAPSRNPRLRLGL
jgi:glycosyltransferase involved in cell wall biosynthesis